MRSWVSLSAILVTACTSPGERLALPPDEAARAVLWSVPGPRLFALDPAAPFAPDDFAAAVDRDALTEIHALSYPQPLDRLGLDAGEVVLDQRGTALPELHDTRLWRRTRGPDGRTPWAELFERPAALTAVRLQRRSPCGAFTIERALPLPNDLTVTQAILQFTDGPPLLAVGSGYHSPATVFPLDGDVIQPSITRLPYTEIHAWDDATVGAPWLAGTSSAGLEIVRLDARARVAERLPAPASSPSAMAARGAAMFLLRDAGLDHWDGARWRRDFETTDPFVEGTNAKVTAPSPDEAFFLLPQGPTVGHWTREGGVRVFPFEPASGIAMGTELVRTLVAHPVLGPIISTSGGVIHRLERWPPRADERWVPFGTIPTGRSAGVMVPFDGGLLAAGIDGFLVEIHEGFGVCPINSVSGINVYQLVPLPDGRWLASGTANGAPGTRAVLLRWARP